MTSLITACAGTTSAVTVTGPSCTKYRFIKWSKLDTEKTVEQVKKHNAVHAVCRREAEKRKKAKK